MNPHLARRLFNRPVALWPTEAETIARLFGLDAAAALADPPPRPGADPGYDVVEGVAIIRVYGVLVQQLGWPRGWCGVTGYDCIRRAVLGALADDGVRAIALDISSPGGEVAGCFDLVDTIYAARGTKPIWAILNECAYSAAYALASACDVITVPRTGGTGSIGVIAMHTDFSRALDQAGIAVTVIQYGDRKSDGSPVKPLSDPALARFQADIDAMGELFVATVARNRGLKADAVRGQQAATFLGAAGVSAGLADAVAAPDEAFAALILP